MAFLSQELHTDLVELSVLEEVRIICPDIELSHLLLFFATLYSGSSVISRFQLIGVQQILAAFGVGHRFSVSELSSGPYLCDLCGEVSSTECKFKDHRQGHDKGRKKRQKRCFGRQNRLKSKPSDRKILKKSNLKSASYSGKRKKPVTIQKSNSNNSFKSGQFDTATHNVYETSDTPGPVDWNQNQNRMNLGEKVSEDECSQSLNKVSTDAEKLNKSTEHSEYSECKLAGSFIKENPKLLEDIIKAIEIEREQVDVTKFGSLFQNFASAVVKGNMKASDLSFSIAASIARLKNVKSNTMLYSKQEYIFWEYIEDMHKPACIRDLIGEKGFGLQKEKGEMGSQNPCDINFNLAIPSKHERVKNNMYRPKQMRPGLIQESTNILMEDGMSDLNLSIDEKFLSSGCKIEIDEESRTVIKGDQEYFGVSTTYKSSSINKYEEGLNHLDTLNKDITSSSVIQLHGLLTSFETSLKDKTCDSKNSLMKMRSKFRKNRVSIAKEVSAVARMEKTIAEIKDLKTKLEESITVLSSSKENIFLLKDFDQLAKDESTASKNLVNEISDNLEYVNTGSNFWKSKINFRNTIPTDYIGRALGQVTFTACKETIKMFVKGQFKDFEYSYSRDQFNMTMLTLSQVLCCIDPNLIIYEIGTVRFSITNKVNLAVIGCSLIQSKVTNEFVYAHLHCYQISDSVLLDLIARMKLFSCSGILTISEDGSPLKILKLENTCLIDEIWTLIVQLLVEVFGNIPLPTKLSDRMKELKLKLKSENLSGRLELITEIPLVSAAEYDFCWNSEQSEPPSVFFTPVLKTLNQAILMDELTKFSERAKDAITEATLLTRPLATQLLLFSVNSLNGRATKSEREDLPTHYARCGKGTRIKEDVRPMIEQAIADIETKTKSKIRSFSADTAYHSLVDFKNNGDPKNILSLQYTVHNRCKANKVLDNLAIIKDHLNDKGLLEVNMPFTWTYKAVGVKTHPPDCRFPNLGDNAVDREMKKLNFPKSASCDTEVVSDELFEEDEPFGTDEENFALPAAPLQSNIRTNKRKSFPTLAQLSESVVLKRKDILADCAAFLLFQTEYKNFAAQAPISEDLVLPGLEDAIEILAIPEISPNGGHLRAAFTDVVHSATRIRANCSSRDILGGKLACYKFVAKEGHTQLKISHIEDRTDMMSEDIARIMFSVQVEARMRNLSHQFGAENDRLTANNFLNTANSCRLVRLYIEAMMGPGISSFERLSCLSFILASLRAQYNPFHFPPGKIFKNFSVKLKLLYIRWFLWARLP